MSLMTAMIGLCVVGRGLDAPAPTEPPSSNAPTSAPATIDEKPNPSDREMEHEGSGMKLEAFEGADFLFGLEEAYTQRRGELQLDYSFSFLTGKGVEREFEWENGKRNIEKNRVREDVHLHVLGLEYGITDRLQIEVEAPYAGLREKSFAEGVVDRSAWGDIELGAAYALVEEHEQCPAITWGADIRLPTGDIHDGVGLEKVGYGTMFAVSKDFGRWVGYLNLGYEFTPDARLQWDHGRFGPELDLNGFEYGIGGLLRLTDDWHLLLELVGETEQELELDDRVWESELMLIPGVRYGVETPKAGEWEVGVGFPIGLTNDSPEWGVIVQVQWEIGL